MNFRGQKLRQFTPDPPCAMWRLLA